MKKKLKKTAFLVMLTLLLGVLSACGIDSTVEDLFTLPRVRRRRWCSSANPTMKSP